MTSAASPFDLDFDLDRIYLEIDPNRRATAWSQSQQLATPASRWRAYLNQVGLQTVLPWLIDEIAPYSRPMLAAPLLPTIWEWVDGVGIDLRFSGSRFSGSRFSGSRFSGRYERLVLLPTEAIDEDELRVPQEWVDIPSWVGDYYAQVLVNVDDGWVKIAGFATHQMLKAEGYLDRSDRTYSLPASSLPASDLNTDINLISVSQVLIPNAVKRASLAASSSDRDLDLTQAQNLIARLSNPELLNPRLEIDFAHWSALMAHGGWRRQMSEQRQDRSDSLAGSLAGSSSASFSDSFSVTQWLQSGLTQLAEQIGWQTVSFQPATVGARGSDENMTTTGLSRILEIAEEIAEEDRFSQYVLQVSPIEGDLSNAWRFELRKLNGFVASGVTLRLLTEDLQPFENNQAIATEPVDVLYVDVALSPGEGIVWEIEPVPAQYEPEILRFGASA